MTTRFLRFAVFVTFFALYLVSASREPVWADSKAAYAVADHRMNDLGYDIGYRWPPGSPPGVDKKFFSPYPFLASLVQYPAAWAEKKIKADWPAAASFAFPIVTHVSCAFFAALSCALFFGLCRRLGVSPLATSLATVGLGLGSLLWPYAHDPFSEALQTACFVGFFAELVEVSERRGWGLALGIWAGLAINTKLIYGLALPGAAIFLLVRLWGDWRRLAVVAGVALVALAPFVVMVAWWNHLRWGTYGSHEIDANLAAFGENPFFGLWGYLASPGRSIFRFSPILVLAFLGLRRFWRRHRAVAIAALATTVPIVYTYCRYAMWPGEQCWGPRYLLFLHPLLFVPVALYLDDVIARGWGLVHKTAIALIFVTSVAVQIVGVGLWRGAYIRISQDVAESWLGLPKKTFDGGIEFFYFRTWLPPFEPVAGQRWLLAHTLAHDPPEVGELDAPWRATSKLALRSVPYYRDAKFDWWRTLYTEDFPQYRSVGQTLLGLELVLLGAGVAGWVFALRRRPGFGQ